MVSSQEIQENLYGLYGDISASGLVSSGVAGGCRFIRQEGFAWPDMVYPGDASGRGDVSGRGDADGPGGLAERPDIAALVESIKTKTSPRLVLFEEQMVTAELLEAMNRFRFVPAAQWVNMTVQLEAGGRVNGGQLDCRVVDARIDKEWEDWSAVAEEVLFKKQKLGRDLFSFGCGEGIFQLILGYYGGEAVCTTLLYRGELAGVYMVATRAAFQGKGLGAAIMRFTGSVAAGDGYSALVLHSTKAGLGLYERLGFAPKGKLLLYYCMA